jgi:hypothetical protein
MNETIMHNELDKLKQILQIPKLYINDKLTQLKSEIDLDYVKQITYLKQSNCNISDIDQLKNEWLILIAFVDTYQDECLKQLTPISKQNRQSALDLINSIEDNRLHKDITDVFELIQAEIFNIESKIFLNKSLLFIKKSNETNSSKLVITPNESISWRAIKQFKDK